MDKQPSTNDSLPGHGQIPREADMTGGRSDPRGSGVAGQDRDLLGAQASALAGEDTASYGSDYGQSGSAGRSRQSEFGAFLDDLTQLVRGQSGGGGGAGSELRAEIERRVGMARERMNDALGQAQEAGAMYTERMRRGLDQSREMVAERPLSAVAVAAIGGLIVGMLLNRR